MYNAIFTLLLPINADILAWNTDFAHVQDRRLHIFTIRYFSICKTNEATDYITHKTDFAPTFSIYCSRQTELFFLTVLIVGALFR